MSQSTDRDEFGRTALLAAVASDDLKALRALVAGDSAPPLDVPALLNAPDFMGRTIWHWLVASPAVPRSEVASLLCSLLDRWHPSLSACQTKSGETPLHWLCGDMDRRLTEHDVTIARALSEKGGVDPLARNATGDAATDLLERRLSALRSQSGAGADAGAKVVADILEALQRASASSTDGASRGAGSADIGGGGGGSTTAVPTTASTSVPLMASPTFATGSSAPAAATKKKITVTLKKK